MNTIPAREIKRRGISAVDELLNDGPVHVIRNNRPQYVILSEDVYARLTERHSLWEWLDRPSRARRTKQEIDAALREERASWNKPG